MKTLGLKDMEVVEGGRNGCLFAITAAIGFTAAAGLSGGLTAPFAALEWSLAALTCLNDD
jgi:hypothetical protein